MNTLRSPVRQTVFACPVDVALSMINGKWKPMILWLLNSGPRRFSDLQTAMPRVTHKVLTQQLRQLENNGLIQRSERSSHSGGYRLTTFGRSLRPALNALANWGKANHQTIGASYAQDDTG